MPSTSTRLVFPDEAVEIARTRLSQRWPHLICAEFSQPTLPSSHATTPTSATHPTPPSSCVEAAEQPESQDLAAPTDTPTTITVRLRPGVRTGADVARLGFDSWTHWLHAWAGDLPAELTVEYTSIVVEHVKHTAPLRALYHSTKELAAERSIAQRILDSDAALTPSTLRAVAALTDADREVLFSALTWLAEHPHLAAFTAKQIRVPGMHTKWLTASRRALIEALTGRDLSDELRPPRTVVPFTYLDPAYRATGGRHHDSWTSGDEFDLPYPPSIVVVVENRECRLDFPEVPGGIAVEGGGNAASAVLGALPWILTAPVLAYWGDLDADGFAILSHLRKACLDAGRDVHSILMDVGTLHEFADVAASTDRHGSPLTPRPAALEYLTDDEQAAYAILATAGNTPVRRIEQEKLPLERAATALMHLSQGFLGG
ncbi:MAG: DUF2220 family protein [Cellulomonadaceae bacterium]|nr:DUF2220 family protein [Cellulomonadaceae bacterium]